MKGPILVVPAFEQGRGGGHLIRSLALVSSLRSLGREAFLHAFSLDGSPSIPPALIPPGFDPSWFLSREGLSRQWDFIVLDRFKTLPEEFEFWSEQAMLIGIDEGGPLRDRFDFLIDLLPGPPGRSPPNILDPGLLPLPRNRRASFRSEKGPERLRILISFGAEDPANLTVPVVRNLAEMGESELTVVVGALGQGGRQAAGLGVTVLEPLPDLRERLADYDLIITHFGLTAFEALYARTPVILVSPGKYHQVLAVSAGFVSAGIGEQGARAVPGLVADLARLEDRCEDLAGRYFTEPAANMRAANMRAEHTLAGFLAVSEPHPCPEKGPVIARFPDRTYRRGVHGMVYMLRLSPPPIEYAKDYFFDVYRRQYGKTYLEDFPNLVKTGKARLGRIKTLLPAGEGLPQLLDIGCAYGPFLVAAQEEGFSPQGVEAASEAVDYVRDELGIPAFSGFFPEAGGIFTDAAFDVVSLWYVIEHFERLDGVLREIHRILKPGGVLAFSTPSFSGISGRRSWKNFLEKSPADHWAVWDPRYAGELLRGFGFELKELVITGHHPERFPVVGRFGMLQGVLGRVSRIFGLGDTFEAYAVKTPGIKS
jgi:SAM-dependent methyltransferase